MKAESLKKIASLSSEAAGPLQPFFKPSDKSSTSRKSSECKVSAIADVLIMAASSFSELKASTSLPNLPRAAKGETVSYAMLQSQTRQCSLIGSWGIFLSGRLCKSRKDRYLPFEHQCVRLLPRTNVLACSIFPPSFAPATRPQNSS